MKKSATIEGESPSRLIDARIKELDDWRGKMLSHVRALIKQELIRAAAALNRPSARRSAR
jgi:hypothetical protein